MQTKHIGTIILVASAAAVIHGLYKKSQLPKDASPDMITQGEIGIGGIGAAIGMFMFFSK